MLSRDDNGSSSTDISPAHHLDPSNGWNTGRRVCSMLSGLSWMLAWFPLPPIFAVSTHAYDRPGRDRSQTMPFPSTMSLARGWLGRIRPLHPELKPTRSSTALRIGDIDKCRHISSPHSWRCLKPLAFLVDWEIGVETVYAVKARNRVQPRSMLLSGKVNTHPCRCLF